MEKDVLLSTRSSSLDNLTLTESSKSRLRVGKKNPKQFSRITTVFMFIIAVSLGFAIGMLYSKGVNCEDSDYIGEI